MEKKEKMQLIKELVKEIKNVVGEPDVDYISVSIDPRSDYFSVIASKGDTKDFQYRFMNGVGQYSETEEI